MIFKKKYKKNKLYCVNVHEKYSEGNSSVNMFSTELVIDYAGIIFLSMRCPNLIFDVIGEYNESL